MSRDTNTEMRYEFMYAHNKIRFEQSYMQTNTHNEIRNEPKHS